jgi:hypothetical protein
MAGQKPQHSRFRRYAKRAGLAFGGLLGLVVVLVVGVLFSLRFAAVRGFVVAKVNGALADSFKGRIQLHGLQSVGLGGIGAADAEIFDPSGRRVIDIHGLDVRLSVPTIVWAALAHKSQPLTVRLDSVSLKHAEVLLVDDGQGSPTLADAFQPKKPSAPSSGPGTIVIIDRALIDHLWAHGALASTPPLDVELKGALGNLRTDDVATTLGLKNAEIHARGLPGQVDPQGQLHASLKLPAAANEPLGAKAHYEGSAANVPIVLDASFIDSVLVATLDAARISPEAVQKQLPTLVLRSPASLGAHAEGKLPQLHGNFGLGIGAGKIEGDFELGLQQNLTAKATVRAHDLDLAELTPKAPASALDMTLHAAVLAPQTGPATGSFGLDSGPSVVAGESVPGLSLTGTFSADSRAKRTRAQAHLEIAETGAETSVDATLEQAAKTRVEFKTATRMHDPPRLRRLITLAHARGELTTQGSYLVDDSELNANARAALRDVQQGNNRVERVRLDARVAGALPHPNADVQLDVRNADLAGQHLTRAQLAARGSLSHVALSLEATTRAPERHVQLSAMLSNAHGISVDHPSLNLRQDNTNLNLSAANVSVVDGRTRVNALHVEGAGKADLSLVYGSALESAYVQTYDLDLARLWRLVDPDAPLRSGTATISARYERQAGNPRVHLSVGSHDLGFNRVKNGSFSADLELNDGRLDGSAHADLKRLGHLNFDFQELRGINVAALDPERITGKLAVDGALELRDVNELVPEDANSPLARMLGSVSYDVAIARMQASPGLPTLHAHVSTKHLQLAGVRSSKATINTKAEAKSSAPLSIKGLDVDIDVSHAETGETELAATLSDEHGRLAALSGEGKATPHLKTIASELGRQWSQIPVKVLLTLPPRELQQLPIEVRPAALSGVLSSELSYEGTVSAPKLKMTGRVDRFRHDATSKRALDLTFAAGYDGLHGKLDGSARSGKRDIAKADIDFETAINAWLNQAGSATPPLDASAHLDFDTFPIALLPGTATSQVDGELSGKLRLDHFGKDATVDGTLDARSLKIGSSPFGDIHTELRARDGKADGSLRVQNDKGVTTAEGHSGLAWGARLVPQVQLPADAQLRAKNLQIGAFSPFVATIFGELDGRLNGDLNAHFKGGAPAWPSWPRSVNASTRSKHDYRSNRARPSSSS